MIMQQLMTGASWRAGRLFGIPISLHWTLGLLVAFDLVRALLFLSFPFSLVWVLVGLAIIGSILFHELAHAMMARQLGYRTLSIELHAFGGFATIQQGDMHPRDQLKVSAAGPFSNLFLWLLLSGIAQVAGPGVLSYGALAVAQTNLFLGLFNLLPAYPLDGGGMLLAWLSMRAPEAQARWLAFNLGRVIAAPLALFGLLTNNLLMALVFFMAYQVNAALLSGVGYVDGWSYWKNRMQRGRGGPRALNIDWSRYSPSRPQTIGDKVRSIFSRRGPRVTPRRTPVVQDPDDDPTPPTIN
jgi:Zn-dependent protease